MHHYILKVAGEPSSKPIEFAFDAENPSRVFDILENVRPDRWATLWDGTRMLGQIMRQKCGSWIVAGKTQPSQA
ncbi:hypothetical protein [Altererythrobacter sp. BO-6]|uniref:hypothetical protein n=1 Tax=Altererythrobacter sp. BO-6 TaxID=2604537 RepID=UPI0019D2C5DA|nr:hypothetical protein [Altererythrobacter sp. BO-6]